MNLADLKRAKELSKQVAALGIGKAAIKKKVQPKLSPFKFDYEALKVKNGKDGKDAVAPSEALLRSLIKPLVDEIKTPELTITPELVKEIVKMMHDLPEQDKLEVSKGIRNAQSFIFGGTKYQTSELMHGGSSASTSTSVFNEVVAGSGTAWTLAHAPNAGTLALYANGQRLTLTVDFTLSGATITTTLSWSAGTLLADYQYT